MSKKALVLDFGGVISKTLFETHELTEKALGLPSGSLTWRGPFAPETDPLWQDMQAGRITERDYWLARAKEVGAMVGQDWRSMKDFVVAAQQPPEIFWQRIEIAQMDLRNVITLGPCVIDGTPNGTVG